MMQAWQLTHEELNQQAHLWVYYRINAAGNRVLGASVMIPQAGTPESGGEPFHQEHPLWCLTGFATIPPAGVEEGSHPLSVMAREVWRWHYLQVYDAVEAGEPVALRVVASFRFDPVLGCETRLWARCVADGVSAGGAGVPCRVMNDNNKETGR